MKTLLSVLLFSLVAASLRAQPTLGHPDFDPFANATASGGTAYTVGTTLAGQTNAQGLPWFAATGSTSNQPTVVSGALTYPGLLADSGNSITYGATTGTSARLDLGTTPANSVISGSSASTVYYSMLFEVTALGGLSTGGAFVAGFNNTTGPQTGQPSIVGARLYARLSGSGYNLGINKANGTATDIGWESTTYTLNKTYFVVAAYTFSGTPSAANDSVSLWVNPPTNTFGTASAPPADITTNAGANIVSGSTEQIASFLLREAATTEPGTMVVDELSVGVSWADVTPVPPPVKVTPSFSNLTASPSTVYGTSVGLSGTLSAAGPVYPAMGETITVTVDGNSQNTTITDSMGDFGFNYNPGTTPVSATPYTITYTYAGDASLTGATNTSTTLLVDAPLPVVLAGSRPYDGTATVAAPILYVANAVGGDVVNVASGTGTLAGASAGAEAITDLGTLTLGGADATNYTLTGTTGSVTITTQPFSVGQPVFEPFADATASNGTAYAVSANLVGQRNAQGLTWFEAGNGVGGQPAISSGALSVPGLLPDPGNAVTFSGASGITARLDLGPTTATSTFTGSNSLSLYYSMAFEVNSLGSLSSIPAVVAGFNNATGSQTSQPGTIGARLYTRLSGAGYNLGINKADGTAADISWETNTYDVGTTYFVVAAYTFSGDASAANDSVSLWVNPPANTFGAAIAPAPDETTSAGPNMGSTSSSDVISSFLLREASAAEPGSMTVDELSIGLSWADVTPAATTVPPFPITASYVDNTGTNFIVTWQSVAGATYHVVGTNSLAPAAPLAKWPIVAGPIVATGNSTSVTNVIAGANEFFGVTSP